MIFGIACSYKETRIFFRKNLSTSFLEEEKNMDFRSRESYRGVEREQQWGGGWNKQGALFFNLETRLNCKISRMIPRANVTHLIKTRNRRVLRITGIKGAGCFSG